MIRGQVGSYRESLIEIEVTGSGSRRLSLSFLLDTGFAGYLTLPSEVIHHLDLIPAGRAGGELANGAQFEFNSYFVTVSWHGRPRLVLALEANGVPLLGTSLLWGGRVTLEMQEGGPVIIDELSP